MAERQTLHNLLQVYKSASKHAVIVFDKRMRPAKIARDLGSWPVWRLSLLYSALHVLALGAFAAGFLLSRLELPDRSTLDNTAPSCACEAEQPVSKVIWMVIDALRWDFVDNSTGASIISEPMSILQTIAHIAVGPSFP